ncbi:MAG: MarR family winged helix-turn-helix transcriptional regulator [Clostridiaceae bacterium]
MGEENLLLNKQLCFRLYKTSRKMTRLYQPILNKLNITYPQYLVMLVLWEHKTIDFKELSDILELKTGTLTPIVKKLVDLDYITKDKNTEDNRKIDVSLTDEGLNIKKQAVTVPNDIADKIGLTFEKYQQYVKVLDEIGRDLDEAEKHNQ